MLNREYDAAGRASTMFIGFVLILVASGCKGDLSPVPPGIKSIADLTHALSEAGAEVVAAEEVMNPALAESGFVLRVNAEPVEVLEFATESDRQAASDILGPDGSVDGGQLADWEGRPNIWYAGRLIVIYPGQDGGTILLLSGLLGDPVTIRLLAVEGPFPPGVLGAMSALAEYAGSAPEDIEVIGYESREWPDSCLGLPFPDEECSSETRLGWRVELRLNGQVFTYRVDDFGLNMRRE